MRHIQPVGDAPLIVPPTYYNQSWALVVGINDYGNQHPRLANARSDAAAVANLLGTDYKFDHVYTLYDGEATRDALVEWLRDRLPKQIGPDDRVVIFFAGHGTTRTGSAGQVRGYLIPQNAKADQYSTYIDMDELRDACGFIPAKHILIILDCCFSGVAAVTTRAVPAQIPLVFTDSYLKQITQRPAWQVLTAGASDELVADSGSRPGHSAFTSALLAGLEGEADTNADGIITATELASFVKPAVSRETGSGRAREQTPYFNYLAGSGQGDFVFLRPDQPIRITHKLPVGQKTGPMAKLPFWLWGALAIVMIMVAILAWNFVRRNLVAEQLPSASATPEVTLSTPVSAAPAAMTAVAASPTVIPTSMPTLSVAYLDFSPDLGRWGVNYYRPESIDLSDTPPAENWIEPPAAGVERLYGILTFADITQVGVILDVLDDTESQIFLGFDGDTDFSDNAPHKTVEGSIPENIEFQIEYADGIRQKYAMAIYYPVAFAREIGATRLHYYRAYVRQGIVNLGGEDYRLAIADDDNDGLYSDLENTEIYIDGNHDRSIIDEERSLAGSSFGVEGTYYIVTDITPSGSRLTITPARFGHIVGRVVDAQTGTPIAGANITLSPNKVSSTSDADGYYDIYAPEGSYRQASVLAEGYAPQYMDLNENVPAARTLTVNVSLASRTSATARSGVIRLKEGDSYHFLLGEMHQYTDGDFYFGFSDGEASFWANNRYQQGLIDLGDLGDTPLSEVELPASGYEKYGVPAMTGHTYVSAAKSGEEGHYIVFRVTSLIMDEYVDIEFLYR
jgi:hypothetical protein